MIYCSTGSLERLFFHPNNNLNERHWVDITMSGDGSTFAVSVCCDDEWIWEFYYDKTNYDLVKHIAMDCIFASEDMDELIDNMDDMFAENFSDIVADTTESEEDDFECDGDCANCSFNEDKYLH